MWGTSDGKGHSLVYYFGLPDGWDPAMVENQAALALWQRFVHDGKEADGCDLVALHLSVFIYALRSDVDMLWWKGR